MKLTVYINFIFLRRENGMATCSVKQYFVFVFDFYSILKCVTYIVEFKHFNLTQ